MIATDIDELPAMGGDETDLGMAGYDAEDFEDEDAQAVVFSADSDDDETFGAAAGFDAPEGSDEINPEDEAEAAASGVSEEQHRLLSSAAPQLARRETLVTGDQRRTWPLMSDFEYAALIGERATQIEQGATDVDERVVELCREHGVTKALDIAEIEIEYLPAPFPLCVHRRLHDETYEVWPARELKIPSRILCESYSDEATEILTAGNRESCPLTLSRALTAFLQRFDSLKKKAL